jgi:hypothetical protein
VNKTCSNIARTNINLLPNYHGLEE